MSGKKLQGPQKALPPRCGGTRAAERRPDARGEWGVGGGKMWARLDAVLYEFFDRKKRILFLALMCYAALC